MIGGFCSPLLLWQAGRVTLATAQARDTGRVARRAQSGGRRGRLVFDSGKVGGMEAGMASEFLEDWLEENVDEAALLPTDLEAARSLALRCVEDALDEGVEEAELIEAAGGDLPARILRAREALTPRQ